MAEQEMNLNSRISRIEATQSPVHEEPQRVIRIVANAEDEAKAHELAKAEGFDRDGDIVILRLIVAAPRPPDGIAPAATARTKPPYVMWRSPE